MTQDDWTDGLHEGIPAEEYHDLDRCSNSRLSLLQRSPAHAKEAMDNPTPSTKAQRIGTATHTAILEPDLLDDTVAVAGQCAGITNSGSRCSRSGKLRRSGQWFCGTHDPGSEKVGEAFGGLVVKSEQMERIEEMRDSVHEHETASDLLKGRTTELTALFGHDHVDEDTGEVYELACKARFDAYDAGNCVLVDLKTTRDASKESFQKDVWRNGYFRQLAFYRHALAECGRGPIDAYIIAVEKKPPHAVAVYELTEMTLKAGWRQLEDLLAQYAECERAAYWPAYPEEAQELELPHWAWDKL
jgi:hypothetical protein